MKNDCNTNLKSVVYASKFSFKSNDDYSCKTGELRDHMKIIILLLNTFDTRSASTLV